MNFVSHITLKNEVLSNEENSFMQKFIETIQEWNSITTVPCELFAAGTLRFSI